MKGSNYIIAELVNVLKPIDVSLANSPETQLMSLDSRYQELIRRALPTMENIFREHLNVKIEYPSETVLQEKNQALRKIIENDGKRNHELSTVNDELEHELEQLQEANNQLSQKERILDIFLDLYERKMENEQDN